MKYQQYKIWRLQGSFRNNTSKAIRGVMKNLVIQIIVSVSILEINETDFKKVVF